MHPHTTANPESLKGAYNGDAGIPYGPNNGDLGIPYRHRIRPPVVTPSALGADPIGRRPALNDGHPVPARRWVGRGEQLAAPETVRGARQGHLPRLPVLAVVPAFSGPTTLDLSGLPACGTFAYAGGDQGTAAGFRGVGASTPRDHGHLAQHGIRDARILDQDLAVPSLSG